MYKYVLKRLLLTIPILLCVTFIVFGIISLIPGDPGRLVLGVSAKQEAVDALNHQLGYDRPFLLRFISYVGGIITRFDFGNSYHSAKPVLKEILDNFRYTIVVVGLGTCIYVTLGILFGVLSAVRQYSIADSMIRTIAITLSAIPVFWIGMMSIYWFSLKLGWFPSNGLDTWKHYVLPVCILGISSSAGLMRLTRTVMLEEIRKDYIRTARAKGAKESSVIWKHAFRNVLLPLIMTVGTNLGYMLGGTVLLETIFSMPGLGSLIMSAIKTKDIPLVMGVTIFLAAIFCLLMLLIDVASAYVDPRVKAKYVN